MITERTRVCPTCQSILPESGPSLCPSCDRVICPPDTEWPPILKAWILDQITRSFFAPFARMTDQHRWERALVSAVAGKRVNGRLFKRAIDAADAYHAAMDAAQKWGASGSRSLVE